MRQACEDGMSEEQIFEYTSIDPWFLAQLGELHAAEQWMRTRGLADLGAEDFLQIKKRGFSDVQIARAVGARICFFTCNRHCLAQHRSAHSAHISYAQCPWLSSQSGGAACMQRVGSCC